MKGAAMTDTKARRVNVVDGDYVGEVIQDDPNGTHMLVPVERVVAAKELANGRDYVPYHLVAWSILLELFGDLVKDEAPRALAEIGGGDE